MVSSAGFAALAAMRLVASELDGFFRVGSSATGIGFAPSFALLGAGHLVGLSVGLAMFVGLIVAWGIATPILIDWIGTKKPVSKVDKEFAAVP